MFTVGIRRTVLTVVGDVLLIADMMSHRVLRCTLEYADRKTAAIP